MAFETLSSDTRLAQALKRLDISIATFWALSDGSVNKTYIQQSVNRTRELTQTEAAKLLQLVKELEDLQSSFPCRVDWSDLRGVGAALARRREQVEQEEFLRRRREHMTSLQELSDEDVMGRVG
jgi:hypothetical protein